MIYFDATRLLEWHGQYTGMEHVAYQFAKSLIDHGGELVYFVPGRGFINVSQDVKWHDSSVTFEHVRSGSIKKMIRSNPLGVRSELLRRRRLHAVQNITFTAKDVFFTSDGLWDRQEYIEAVIAITKASTKLVHLVHDIVPIVVPHLVHDYMTGAMTNYFKQVAPHIDVLISISKNTETDFIRVFGQICKHSLRHYLFHHGDDVPDVNPIMPAKLKSVKEFLLCVGTIEIRKNHMLLYQAYKLAAEKKIEIPPMVIIGRDGWLSDQTLKLMREDPIVCDKFIFLGPAPNSEMVWCYKNCLFTVMPSFYEGWGLQVAQSLYFGKVAAVSNVGPLPEVGGRLNVYYSPYNADDCLRQIHMLLDKKVLEKHERCIQRNYRPTSWCVAVDGAMNFIKNL